MGITVSLAQDADRFLATDLLVWADGRPEAGTEHAVSGIPAEHRFAAETATSDQDPSRYAGVYGVYPLTLSIPGPLDTVRQVPVAGLTWVGVHPDERRQGVLGAMLRHHLDQVRAAESPGCTGLSVLHASETAIYGRFGYQIASREAKITLGRGTTFTAPGLTDAADEIRIVQRRASAPDSLEHARSAALFTGAGRVGTVVRPSATSAVYAGDGPIALTSQEPLQALLASDGDQPVGIAWFRRKPSWSDTAQPEGVVEVGWFAGTPAAQLAMLRRLVDVDLMATTTFNHADPALIAAWTGSARGVFGPQVDSMWVRLADLPHAMAARGYAGAADLVLQITDDTLTQQSGRWRLRVGADGVGQLLPSTDQADLSLSIGQLAGGYLGETQFATLARAGVLTEHRAGAAGELDRAMRTAVSPAPAIGF